MSERITRREFEAARSEFDIFLRQPMSLGTAYVVPKVQSDSSVEEEKVAKPIEDFSDFGCQQLALMTERYEHGLIDEELYRRAVLSLMHDEAYLAVNKK